MAKPKGCPKQYLYRGQINYLKIARETDWIQTNKLETFTKKVGNSKFKLPKKNARQQYFIDTYGDIEVALNILNRREQEIIIHLYGLDGSEPMSQEQIGKKLFLSGSIIGRIKNEALERLEALKKDPESTN